MTLELGIGRAEVVHKRARKVNTIRVSSLSEAALHINGGLALVDVDGTSLKEGQEDTAGVQAISARANTLRNSARIPLRDGHPLAIIAHAAERLIKQEVHAWPFATDQLRNTLGPGVYSIRKLVRRPSKQPVWGIAIEALKQGQVTIVGNGFTDRNLAQALYRETLKRKDLNPDNILFLRMKKESNLRRYASRLAAKTASVRERFAA